MIAKSCRWTIAAGRYATIVTLCCVPLTGCGSKEKVPGSATKATVSPKIDRSQPGAAAGQPGEIVVRMWTYLRDGLVPLAINAFDRSVVRQIGAQNLLGALNVAQGTTVAYAPRITRTVAVKSRNLPDDRESPKRLSVVYVQGRGVQGAVTHMAFLLQRAPSGWAIIYDTMSDGALRGYLTGHLTNLPNPKLRRAPGPAGEFAGDVSRAYQRRANALASNYF